MTGNVVFLGFGIAGARGISVWASLTALASFLLGAFAVGRVGVRWSNDRGRHFTATTTAELLLMAAALVVAAFSSHHIETESRYALIVLLAIAMGIQNSGARKLAVPDLSTNVLTTALTDAALTGERGAKVGPRALSVAAMLLGALIGGLLVLKVDNPAPLALATGLLAAVSLFTYRASRSRPRWA
jgi:uncharacterized membrane protein YoaK (UPF0700 family)